MKLTKKAEAEVLQEQEIKAALLLQAPGFNFKINMKLSEAEVLQEEEIKAAAARYQDSILI